MKKFGDKKVSIKRNTLKLMKTKEIRILKGLNEYNNSLSSDEHIVINDCFAITVYDERVCIQEIRKYKRL